jgi:3-isopropylmalate dehydrogenase
LAAILSFAMALRFSLNRADLADKVEQAVNQVLAQGTRTADILGDLASSGTTPVSTQEMGAAVICALAG